MEKKEEKTKKKKKPLYFLIAAILLLIVFFGMIPIDDVSVVGNKQFTKEEICNDLFAGKKTERLGVLVWNRLVRQQRDIPYLIDYKISLNNYHAITVEVEEKEIFGCLDYGGVYIYIDSTGTVLASEREVREHIPILEGIYVTEARMYHTIQSKQLASLEEMEHIEKLLNESGVEVDILCYSPQGTIRVNIGAVRVLLGDNKNIEEKITVLAAMIPQFEGLAGTLYLNEYDPKNVHMGYRFEVAQ